MPWVEGGEIMGDKLSEEKNFSFILQGEKNKIKKIKKYIITEYENKGIITLIKSMYDKKEIHFLTKKQWEKYQKLKNKDNRMIGPYF